MPELDSTEADDRVLPLTRGIAAVIVPFLVVGFAVLYLWPGDTDRPATSRGHLSRDAVSPCKG